MPYQVTEAIWRWREERGSVHRRVAENAYLRRRAVIQFIVMAGVGALLYFLIGHHTVGLVVWGLALVILLFGLALPKFYRPINKFGEWLGRAVGGLLTYLMLVPLFFLLFVPAALYLKLKKRDPMKRHGRDPNHTYWIPRRIPAGKTSYQRQFLVEDGEAKSLLRPVGPHREIRSEAQP
jgi:hypothetical protein